MTISPSTRRRQQALARWVRRLPGLGGVADHSLARLRRSPVALDLASRFLRPTHRVGHEVVPFRAGAHIGAAATAHRLPILGIVALGLSREDVGSVIQHVVALQDRLGSFRALLVVDQAVFDLARPHGLVLEVLTPESTWTGDVHWDAYVGRRLVEVIDHYQLWHLTMLGVDGRWDPLLVPVLEQMTLRLPADLRPITD